MCLFTSSCRARGKCSPGAAALSDEVQLRYCSTVERKSGKILRQPTERTEKRDEGEEEEKRIDYKFEKKKEKESITKYKLCLLTYKTLTNQQPTYLYNSLSFLSHSVST